MASLRIWRIAIPALAGLAAPAGTGNAQETGLSSQPVAQAWLAQRLMEFQEYDFERGGAERGTLVMEPRALLNWSNPERGTGRGAVYLWTHEGRPQVIACAFEWGGSVKHEFHSLSTDSVVAQRRGNAVHRFGPGIEWMPLPGAPEPATQRALRLSQMRRLAERFRVRMGRQEEWSETRLLPQPVFRSSGEATGDVAVLVFVQGTDPECTLLLEATPQKEWRYALARQTKWGVKVELDGNLVWECRPFSKPDPQSPFLVLAPTL